MRIQFTKNFEEIASIENLLGAWEEFLPGKRKKADAQEFGLRLMDNIFALHDDLMHHSYRHGGYHAFNISDPKPRSIHKASVRDRLLHHAIHRVLYPFFDRTFIADSFSCREGKGTHAALDRFQKFAYKESKNHTRTVWVLKCDVRKFFANIDHATLLDILTKYIPDKDVLLLLWEIIGSFSSTKPGVGLPLGNLTSQLFVNIYMNEFDQFVKHKLKIKYYIRYADDFIFLYHDRKQPEVWLLQIEVFLREKLKLSLHPDKVFIKTLASGVDFLGWVHFPDHRVLRAATKRRMFARVAAHPADATIVSYRGMLSHGNTRKLQGKLFWGAWIPAFAGMTKDREAI